MDVFRTKSTFDADIFCQVAGHGMTICRKNEEAASQPITVDVGDGSGSGDVRFVGHGGPAIEVRNACKSFRNKVPVLENLNMTVETGSIYSLLGSSGSGKTTLLSCCIGLQKLDQGTVKVFQEPPGSRKNGVQIGYMPQELSLYNEFSIGESMNYFGRLYGMSKENIKIRMESILKLLDLPSASRRINTLSGGQKRRVSFAIATFHQPQILILDEPTVGVDPLLRESIWTFLKNLVSLKRTTVIITTHYYSECSESNMLGVMRGGRLLVEKSPQELMAQFKLPLLEQIVLTLCQNDSNRSSPEACHKNGKLVGIKPPCISNVEPEPAKNYNRNLQRYQHHRARNNCSNIFSIGGCGPFDDGIGTRGFARKCDKESNSKSSSDSSSLEDIGMTKNDCFKDASSSLHRLQALTIKNFVVLLRSVWFLLFIFVVPAIQIILICLAIGPDPKALKFGVINQEMLNNSSGILVEELCIPNPGCGIALSCRYLSMLPQGSLYMKNYTNEEDAMADIKSGVIWGYLNFPQNYSAFLVDRGGNPAFALDETYDGSRITFEMDMSNQQIGHNLKRIFIEVYYKFLVQVAVDCGLNPRQVELPLNFKTPVYGSADGSNFSEFLAPSVFLGLLFFFPLCSSGISYISEKKSGTLNRSLVAGVSVGEMIIAFLLSQVVVLLIQSGLAFLILNVIFQIPIQGSVPLGLTLAILVGIGGMSMGFLISSCCEEEIHAVLIAIGTFFPNFLLSGMVWPIQGMPTILQYIAYLLPCTLACESMRSIVSRGWGFLHPSVFPGFLSTVAWIIFYWIVTIVLQKFKART